MLNRYTIIQVLIDISWNKQSNYSLWHTLSQKKEHIGHASALIPSLNFEQYEFSLQSNQAGQGPPSDPRPPYSKSERDTHFCSTLSCAGSQARMALWPTMCSPQKF